MGSYAAEIRKAAFADGDASARPAEPDGLVISHHLADTAAVRIERPSGGHLLHLAVAGCVFNTVFQVAERRGVAVHECRVLVDGDFEDERSIGIDCDVELGGAAPEQELRAIAEEAFAGSTIANILREGTRVELREVTVHPADR